MQVKKASEIGLTDVKAIDKDNNNITLSINADDMKWGILATDKSTYLLKKWRINRMKTMPSYFPYGKPPTSGMIRRNILSIGQIP